MITALYFCYRVVLVITKNWDWSGLFAPALNKNLAWTAPLVWSYTRGSGDNSIATSRYKDWGDANQDWFGESGDVNGESLHFLSHLPNKADF